MRAVAADRLSTRKRLLEGPPPATMPRPPPSSTVPTDAGLVNHHRPPALPMPQPRCPHSAHLFAANAPGVCADTRKERYLPPMAQHPIRLLSCLLVSHPPTPTRSSPRAPSSSPNRRPQRSRDCHIRASPEAPAATRRPSPRTRVDNRATIVSPPGYTRPRHTAHVRGRTPQGERRRRGVGSLTAAARPSFGRARAHQTVCSALVGTTPIRAPRLPPRGGGGVGATVSPR